MSVKIKIDVFEGPFDLLFHLIEKEEINIYDIPIAKITEQYLAYIEEMLSFDLDVASEFLVMAANLLAIKARMLLPKTPRKSVEEQVEEDPRTELVEKLLEYKKIKAASDFLRQQAGQAALAIPRPDESDYYLSVFGEPEIKGISLTQITDAFIKILARLEKIPPVIRLQKREITVGEKMEHIMLQINTKATCGFEELFSFPCSRIEIVITFLAILELIRLRKILIRQEVAFGEIILVKRYAEGEA